MTTTSRNPAETSPTDDLALERFDSGPPEVEVIANRLRQAGVQRPHVQQRYLRWFRRFAEAIDWCAWSVDDLEGPVGRQAILGWLSTRPLRFRRSLARTIKSVWTQAAGLQWPLVERRDLRGLPPTRTSYPPDDSDVCRWQEGVLRHPVERERLICLLILETGMRPEQLAKLRVEDVRRDPAGCVTAIVASGADHDFKRPSDLVVRLAPAAAGMLQAWLLVAPAVGGWLLPRHRGRWDLQTKPDQIRYTFRKVARSAGVPRLTPRQLRHWVARVTRNARMQEFAACRHQGWQSPGTTMHDRYGTPSLDDILREQERCLPKGPGGQLTRGTKTTIEEQGGAAAGDRPRTEANPEATPRDIPRRPDPSSGRTRSLIVVPPEPEPMTLQLRLEIRIEGSQVTITPPGDGLDSFRVPLERLRPRTGRHGRRPRSRRR